MSKKRIVILTGAGISAESGLKTFRDSDGLWNGYNIEEVATPRGWRKNPSMVIDFYNMRRREVAKALPNAAHLMLAAMQEDFDIQIITQNIDDLHERAGSKKVLHLHGEIFKMRSERNPALIYEIRHDIELGDTAEDGAQLRPNIVWFEEPVPLIEEAAYLTSEAAVFAVIGTSLAVYPAAGLINCTSPGIPKFIVDKNIPNTSGILNLTTIELPATSGVEVLKKKILELNQHDSSATC